MKIRILTLSLCTIAFLGLSSCEEGPAGPNPGQEMVTFSKGNIGQDIIVSFTANLQMHGDEVLPTFLRMQSDQLLPSRAQFQISQTYNPLAQPVVDIYFKGGLPSQEGEYAWEETKITPAPSYSQQVVAGAVIRYNSFTYFPVSGKTVITFVRKNGNNITGIEGYFNGRCRAQWPDGGAGAPNPLPPDFDASNPKLVGEELVAASCVFFTRSAASIPIQ